MVARNCDDLWCWCDDNLRLVGWPRVFQSGNDRDRRDVERGVEEMMKIETADGSPIHLGMHLWIVDEVPQNICSIVVTGIVEFHAGIVRLLNRDGIDAYSDWAYVTHAKAAKERARLDGLVE